MTAPYEPPRTDGPHPADRNTLGETRLETVQRRLKASYFADPEDLVWAEFIAHAPEDIDWLIAEVERLRGRLDSLEWGAPEWDDLMGEMCPVCWRTPTSGHEDGCWLDAEIHGAK